jgi:membrane protein implicated in regulation of membrane protease activity
MSERAHEPKKRDYSCEILSFIVLVILSDLSHFWLIVIAICIGIVFWGAIVFFGQLLLSAFGTLLWRPRVRQINSSMPADSGNQFFLPREDEFTR